MPAAASSFLNAEQGARPQAKAVGWAPGSAVQAGPAVQAEAPVQRRALALVAPAALAAPRLLRLRGAFSLFSLSLPFTRASAAEAGPAALSRSGGRAERPASGR